MRGDQTEGSLACAMLLSCGWQDGPALSRTEQPAAADTLQRPLRSRFQVRLTPSVRCLRRGGSGEEILCGPSAWAHDNVHP
jgi:hypothetical protein